MSEQLDHSTSGQAERPNASMDIFMGGFAIAGGLGFTALNTIHAFREKDLSNMDLALTIGTTFMNGVLVTSGGALINSGIRQLRSRDRQQG